MAYLRPYTTALMSYLKWIRIVELHDQCARVCESQKRKRHELVYPGLNTVQATDPLIPKDGVERSDMCWAMWT